MKSITAGTKRKPAWSESAPPDIDEECALWDWARTAGVSAAELREALRASLGGTPGPPPD